MSLGIFLGDGNKKSEFRIVFRCVGSWVSSDVYVAISKMNRRNHSEYQGVIALSTRNTLKNQFRHTKYRRIVNHEPDITSQAGWTFFS